MAFYKHCCRSIITEDHTDHCLSRQDEIARLQALVSEQAREIARLVEAIDENTFHEQDEYTSQCLPNCWRCELSAALAARGGEVRE